MVSNSEILEVLHTIPDPEMPISITDLGLIEDIKVTGTEVHVTVLPTFIGCFALPVIADEIKTKLEQLDGVERVEVGFVHDPPGALTELPKVEKLR